MYWYFGLLPFLQIDIGGGWENVGHGPPSRWLPWLEARENLEVLARMTPVILVLAAFGFATTIGRRELWRGLHPFLLSLLVTHVGLLFLLGDGWSHATLVIVPMATYAAYGIVRLGCAKRAAAVAAVALQMVLVVELFVVPHRLLRRGRARLHTPRPGTLLPALTRVATSSNPQRIEISSQRAFQKLTSTASSATACGTGVTRRRAPFERRLLGVHRRAH